MNQFNFIKDIVLLIIIVVLVWLLFFKVEPISTSTSTTIIVRDTTIDTTIQTNLKPTYVTNDNSVTVLPSDTNMLKAFLNDYFAIKSYNDTVRNDSSMMVVINDSITKNMIKFRSVFTKNNRPTSITTNTTNNIYQDKGFFVQGSTLFKADAFESVLVGGGYKKGNQSVSLSIGTSKFIMATYTYGFYKFK